MGEVPYVAGARLIELSLTPSVPGQIRHVVPSTGEIEIFNRGYGLWTGIARFHSIKGDIAGQIEAMFAALNGAENFVELPLRGRKTLEAATSISRVNGTVYTLTAAVGGLGRGTYIRSGDRVFIISAQPSAREIQLWPPVPLEIGDDIGIATTIRARSPDSSVPDLPSTPNWSGPWVFGFQEAI